MWRIEYIKVFAHNVDAPMIHDNHNQRLEQSIEIEKTIRN
jgi:hypothetical protein